MRVHLRAGAQPVQLLKTVDVDVQHWSRQQRDGVAGGAYLGVGLCLEGGRREQGDRICGVPVLEFSREVDAENVAYD